MKRPKILLFVLAICFSGITMQAQTIERNKQDNTITSITFAGNTAPEASDLEALVRKYMQLDNNYSLEQKFRNEQKDGSVITRYNLLYDNIKIQHASVSIIVRDDKVRFVTANMFVSAAMPPAATGISEEQALQKATDLVGAKQYMWEIDKSLAKPIGELVYVQDFRQEELQRKLHLAYKFDVYANEPLSRDKIYVDANTGDILLRSPVIKHVTASGASLYSGSVVFDAANTGTNQYELYDSNRLVITYDLQGSTNLLNGVPVTSSTTSFSKSAAIDAHWGATMVYDYWMNEHNRASYDGLGTELYSFVNYFFGYNNAFWNGTSMVYGSGAGMFPSGFDPLTSLDVCAHEVGHGVCEYTSGLEYNRESGAMNEGFSDIWGAVIENYADPNKQMWSMGEEIGKRPLRSMREPNLFNDPNTHGGTHWVTVAGCNPSGGNDYCGVHTNSGVLNKWFYLLTDGGRGTNDNNDFYEVAGIGVEKAAKIAYGTEQVLSSTATYADCRTASIGVATTLYGNCSRELEALIRAWHAVGVGNAFVPCSPQVGFSLDDTTISRTGITGACPAAKTISIPLRITGNAPSGGNASVAITGTGSAVSGVDYNIVNSPLTFNGGSTATQMAQVSIFDIGDVSGDKELVLHFTITQNGSNLSKSYTYDSCIVKITGTQTAPDTGGTRKWKVNNGDVVTKAVTPFFSRNRNSRLNFIITAQELLAAGVKPNEAINGIEFNVKQKNSAQAFSGFTLKIGTTNLADHTGGIPSVSTQYYSGNYTTQAGWNTIPFSSQLIWNGTDNLVFETCFANGTAGTENDYIEAIGTDKLVSAVAYSDGGSGGCSLPFSGNNAFFSGVSKPVIRVLQTAQATLVEKNITASKEWNVQSGQDIYFLNDTTNKLIANVATPANDLGCVKAEITQMGSGFTALPAPFSSNTRSRKEFALSATQNQATTAHTLTLYFDTSEYAGGLNIKMIATSATHDSLMNKYNTTMISPLMTKGKNAYAFKANVTGVSPRYFLIDGSITLPDTVTSVNEMNNSVGKIRVVNNPFVDKIYLEHSLQETTTALISLYDITGKQVIYVERELIPGNNRIAVDLSATLLVPGNYILQVITEEDVLTQKMLKQ